jgi:hypothetical protein
MWIFCLMLIFIYDIYICYMLWILYYNWFKNNIKIYIYIIQRNLKFYLKKMTYDVREMQWLKKYAANEKFEKKIRKLE